MSLFEIQIFVPEFLHLLRRCLQEFFCAFRFDTFDDHTNTDLMAIQSWLVGFLLRTFHIYLAQYSSVH